MAAKATWLIERSLVLEAALKLVEKGLVLGKAGNVSQRLKQPSGPDLLVITPTSRYYDSLAPEDMPVVDLDSRVVDGVLAPSSELKLHIAIYKAREDVGAVVHTHSIHASALAVAHLGIPAVLEEEVALLGGGINVAEYGASGSDELANNAVDALRDNDGVILANHGAVGVGRTLRGALDAAELIEKAAEVYLLARTTGSVKLLSVQSVAAAREVFRHSKRSREA